MNIENIKANVDHPAHYGGKDNPYETIKVIEAWGLDNNFDIATAIKYLSRLGKKAENPFLQDLMKAKFYIDHEIEKRSKSVTEDPNVVTGAWLGEFYKRLDDATKRLDSARDDAIKNSANNAKAKESDVCTSCNSCNKDCVHTVPDEANSYSTYIEVPESIGEAISKIGDYFFDNEEVTVSFDDTDGSIVFTPYYDDDDDDYDEYGYFR